MFSLFIHADGTGGSGSRPRPRLDFSQLQTDRYGNHYGGNTGLHNMGGQPGITGNGSHGGQQQPGRVPNLRLDFSRLSRLNINDSGGGSSYQQNPHLQHQQQQSWVGARQQHHPTQR